MSHHLDTAPPTYTQGLHVGYSPAQALASSLLPDGGYSPSWHAERVERVCTALFSVLTQSQQERVLFALGWQRVAVTVPPKLPEPGTEPTAAVHDPEPRS